MNDQFLTFFRSVIDNMADGILIMDPNQIVIYHNRAFEEITFLEAYEVIGSRFDDFRSRNITDEVNQEIWDCVSQKSSWNGELIFSGGERGQWFSHTTISRVFDEKGEMFGYVAIFRDITQRKIAQAKLEKSTSIVRRYEGQVKRAKLESVNLLLKASLAKDNDTGGHVNRIRFFATELAIADGMNEKEAIDLGYSATLHDIGKLRIPDSILKKPDRLTLDEWKIMQKHPTYGYQILQEAESFDMDCEIALQHHEMWDGNGYPQAMKGEDISYAARIVTIVDVYDALASKRPYKKPWTKEEIFQYLSERSGTQFDPHLIPKYIELGERGILDKIRFRFSDEVDHNDFHKDE